MRVLSMRRTGSLGSGISSVIAYFDAEVAPGVRVNNLRLKQNPAGRLRIYGPRTGNADIVHFAPALQIHITEAATAALREGRHADEQRSL